VWSDCYRVLDKMVRRAAHGTICIVRNKPLLTNDDDDDNNNNKCMHTSTTSKDDDDYDDNKYAF